MALADRRRSPRRLPPGPSGLPVIGRQFALFRRPLDFLMRAHLDYGDLVSLPLNGGSVVAAFGAEHVDAVTAAAGKEVEISMAGGVELETFKRGFQGRGPLNSTGAEHTLYRRVSLRAAHGSTASYAAITAELTERMLDGWLVGSEVDLLPVMGGLTRRIFKYYMFGTDLAVTDPELDAAVDRYMAVMDSGLARIGSSLIPFNVAGLSKAATMRRDLALMDSRVAAIASGSHATTRRSLAEAILAELARAGLKEDPALTRELMLQLYFAGLTSVASTIVWTLLLLALHPDPARRVLDELTRELGGQLPEQERGDALPELEAVLEESMRLYPGAAYEFKHTEDELNLGGYLLPVNFPLLLVPWVTQRSSRSFDDPECFRPERFIGRKRTYRKGAFSPWGFGNRSCIGKVLARSAIKIIVSGVTQRFRLDLVAGQRIEPHPGWLGIRLLPRPGVRVRVVPQDGQTERSVAVVAGSIVGGVPGPFSARHRTGHGSRERE